MVNAELIRLKLEEIATFFIEVRENSSNDWDQEKSQDGLKEVKALLHLIETKKSKLRNKELKRLHIGFSFLTHGVERLMDYALDQKYRKIIEDIYELKKDIESQINW